MKSSTAELFARYLTIALLLRKKSKAIVRINGHDYTPIDAARHYCGSECLTRRGVLRDYIRWMKAGIKCS